MFSELLFSLKHIEQIRKEMVALCERIGFDMSDPEVIRLSQLLDTELNQYEVYKNKLRSAS
ncbi:MAG: aspartyl-phosphate phosphatase Spo0E family protein [Candidatus Cohnella colombiensis]|uniref:Aspartyl-phosphate phosphatase Spo0E family protein n=1 Tax=Candidatus Cohnella colombiensis TaxID=3121368 RepID=A0AA95EYJ1_9BACL|nr:MAG: aspartyl-phosphate phosphatase Spo0E family protein [Cohnella sp.]